MLSEASGCGGDGDSYDLYQNWVDASRTLRCIRSTILLLIPVSCSVFHGDTDYEQVKAQDMKLSEYETDVLAPILLDKCGQSKDRFKNAMLSVVRLLEDVAPAERCTAVLLATVALGKNNRSRVLCLEEVRRRGLGALDRKPLRL